MKLQGIHHVAYRCNDAKETVEFYQQVLGMDFQLAIAEDRVPSTGEPDPLYACVPRCGQWQRTGFFRST